VSGKPFYYLVILAVICLLPACADHSVSSTPSSGFSLYGTIESIPETWSGREIDVYAALFQGDVSGEGYYVLEPDLYPHASMEKNGRFVISELSPGTYILLAGPSPEEALRLVNETGDQVIIEFKGERMDLGKLFLQ
jgi:hypothetical protein